MPKSIRVAVAIVLAISTIAFVVLFVHLLALSIELLTPETWVSLAILILIAGLSAFYYDNLDCILKRQQR